jgi:hypothetical protein
MEFRGQEFLGHPRNPDDAVPETSVKMFGRVSMMPISGKPGDGREDTSADKDSVTGQCSDIIPIAANNRS